MLVDTGAVGSVVPPTAPYTATSTVVDTLRAANALIQRRVNAAPTHHHVHDEAPAQ